MTGTIDISQSEEVLLWADSLCINQENIAERNMQVAMMASIFRQASAVIGWLGNADARQAASVLTRALNRAPFQYRCGLGNRKSVGEMLHDSPTESYVCEMLEAIAVLATDSYWTRLWIVQEMVLARTFWILCQDDFLSWNDYNALFDYVKILTENDSKLLERKTYPFVREFKHLTQDLNA